MFKEVKGDLFAVESDALAHGVNTRGFMGAGIALPFKQKFPLMYEEYALRCNAGLLQPGEVFPYYVGNRKWVYNIASQQEPGPDARLYWLTSGVWDAMRHAETFGVKEIAMPLIGCGIGGLDYEGAVKPALANLASLRPLVNLLVVTL